MDLFWHLPEMIRKRLLYRILQQARKTRHNSKYNKEDSRFITQKGVQAPEDYKSSE